jgi:ubiquinone/menaquinone biosynthesis C-methylase UbiE
MYLPPKHHIPALEDPIAYYYIPIFRSFFIKRLQMCLDLLPRARMSRLLDVGCGTGIILPELLQRCDHIWAVDSQLQERSLQGMMQMEKMPWERIQLATADLLHLPFADNHFDAVLLISILEHIEDLPAACAEIVRVTRPGGIVVAGFPTKNAITDKLLGGSTGFHVSSHRQILDTLKTYVHSFRITRLPCVVPVDFSLYVACSGVKSAS